MEKSPKEPNFYELSQERQAIRKTLKEAKEGELPENITIPLYEEKKRLDKEVSSFSIQELGGISKAKEKIIEDKKEREALAGDAWIQKESIAKEVGPAFNEIEELKDKLGSLNDFEMRRLREAKTDPYARKIHSSLIESIRSEKTTLSEKNISLEKKDPLAARAVELVRYKKGLHKEGHIAPTPSAEKNLSEIGMRMTVGKPMFLHGPTGTGKTSLGRFAAERFTGESPEMVYCNPQTRESNIWGKTGIRPTESGPYRRLIFLGRWPKPCRKAK